MSNKKRKLLLRRQKKALFMLWLLSIWLSSTTTTTTNYTNNITGKLFHFVVLVGATTTTPANEDDSSSNWRLWNYYQLLGLEEPNSKKKRTKVLQKQRAQLGKSEIKAAYKKQAQLYHPDKVVSWKQQQQQSNGTRKTTPKITVEEATERFAAIAHAYKLLSNEKSKIKYDKELLQENSSSSHHSFHTNNNNNNNNILQEYQFLDIYSTPLQSSNGMYMAYLTANCEFIICQREETTYNSWVMIWSTTTNDLYSTTTTQCRVTLVGPQLLVLFYPFPRSSPQIIWKSSNDDDDEEYEDYLRRRKRKQHLQYYLKLQNEGVLVLYKQTKQQQQQHGTTKQQPNLIRGLSSLWKRTPLFSKYTNHNKKTNQQHDQDKMECVWSSAGIQGRAGCAMYAVQTLVQTQVGMVWNHLWETVDFFSSQWSYEHIRLKTTNLIFWGRNLVSKSYIRLLQIVEQAQHRAKERVDF